MKSTLITWKDKWNYKVKISNPENRGITRRTQRLIQNPTHDVYEVRDLKKIKKEIVLITLLLDEYNKVLKWLHCKPLNIPIANIHIISEYEYNKKIRIPNGNKGSAGNYVHGHCYLSRGDKKFLNILAHELAHMVGLTVLHSVITKSITHNPLQIGMSRRVGDCCWQYNGLNEALTEVIGQEIANRAMKTGQVPSMYITNELNAKAYPAQVCILEHLIKRAISPSCSLEDIKKTLVRLYITGNYKYLKCIIPNEKVAITMKLMGTNYYDAQAAAHILGNRKLIARIKKT
jgi:hypothetical protein